MTKPERPIATYHPDTHYTHWSRRQQGFARHVFQTDFDHYANFGQYKTYSWQEIKPGASLWDARKKSAVNAQLEAKGLRLSCHGYA